MSLITGCDNLIDQHLKIDNTWVGQPPRFSSKTSLQRMQDENLPDGKQMITDLYNLMVQNWIDAEKPQNCSSKNWRFDSHREFQPDNPSPEVVLERTIIEVVDHENWANQIPVDSGLLGKGNRSLDLVFRSGTIFELIELKVDSNTPLSAAFQVLLYGLTNVFFRLNSEELNTDNLSTPLLDATEIRLRVLAPYSFYTPFADRYDQTDWLKKFEDSLDQGVQEFSSSVFSESGVKITGFQFDIFPNNFQWDVTKHNDEQHRGEVLVAVHQRHACFG